MIEPKKEKSYEAETDIRRKKYEALKKAHIDPFPSSAKRTHSIMQLHGELDKDTVVIITGRVRSIRAHGASTFAHIEDGTGMFQIYIKKDTIGDNAYALFSESVDMGDFIEISGTVFTTKKGEPTVLANQWRMLSKALRPLPEKWHGLVDTEARFRKRYLDILANPEVRKVFITRARIIGSIREFLNSREYLEVETPILQPLPGGAIARPFVTHHNALNHDLYLRIAPELYLKRLIVAGYERVYEIARCFRNEGIDWSHNPEFTQVELYEAYMDYYGMMALTEDLLRHILMDTVKNDVMQYQGHSISFKHPFAKITFREAIRKQTGIDIEEYPDRESLYKKAREHGLSDITPDDHRGKLCDGLFKEYVRPALIQPTFVMDHPIELSPLAKKKSEDDRYVERFQLVAGAIELVNAFSELNDPVDQLERFTKQQRSASQEDEEAHPIDTDFIEALEHGMPPTAGFGMGIDRLTCLLADRKNIKEVIIFPTLRPKEE